VRSKLKLFFCASPLIVLLGGCSGVQSALAPIGPSAQSLYDLFVVMLAGATIIWLLMMALAAFAWRTKTSDPNSGWGHYFVLVGGIGFPVVVLSALLTYGLKLAPELRADDGAIEIDVTGRQYWWEFRYPRFAGSPTVRANADAVVTANELVLPVGQRVILNLRSEDVIHSFWVPALAGKLDLIPGRTNRLQIEASKTGNIRGQCAEFCGTSHAFMAFPVRIVTEIEFETWLTEQASNARDPVADLEQAGYELFFEKGCQACHAVRGTPAAGQIGPDLTHYGSRPTVAAGLIPNNPGTTAGWIAAAQDLKPGNAMPSFDTLSGRELRALSAYLASLK
jgi:cytochrome c oxidase subunit 2